MAYIAVIGGGPAGILAAHAASCCGHSVVLYEKNEKLGKKLYITGKGRCNITNSAESEEFFGKIIRNPKFMYSALAEFSNTDLEALLRKNGVELKTERGGRMFPQSDKSSDIIRAFTRMLDNDRVRVELNNGVRAVSRDEVGFTVVDGGGREAKYEVVIIACGGVSYPSTGSTGDGFAFARSFGHAIVEPKPALIPLETEQQWPCGLMGLTLKNVTLRALVNGKCVYEELGEMLFTHFGVSGPLVLSASSMMAGRESGAVMEIDLKPGLSAQELDKRMLRDFEENHKKQLKNALFGLLPQKLVPVVIAESGVDGEKNVSDISRKERQALCYTLKCLKFDTKCARPISEAIITAGGVSTKEINSSTMESKLVKGLYFAGETIDVDALTGGFNLQIACSTGVLAGKSAAQSLIGVKA